MSDANFTKLARNKDLIDAIKHSRCVIRIWQEVCDILQRDDIDVSGRLTLTQSVGQRVVEWKGVERIKKQFQVPTLMLDATLPALPVLQVYHPEVEIVADIKVALPPCARIRQALGAPTSASKLIRSSDRLKHLQAVRRYIIKRHIETGQQATLIICQE